MKNAIIALVLTASCFAQTAQPTKPVACKESKDAAKLKEYMAADLDRERTKTADLEKRLAESDNAKIEAQAKLAAAETVLAEMRDAGTKLVVYTTALETEYKKNLANYSALTDKYNSTLQDANNIINNQNARLARQQRVNNALALYSAMPKAQPYVLPPPPVFTAPANTSINCTSTKSGDQTYTNCH